MIVTKHIESKWHLVLSKLVHRCGGTILNIEASDEKGKVKITYDIDQISDLIIRAELFLVKKGLAKEG